MEKKKAEYGEAVLKKLSVALASEFQTVFSHFYPDKEN